MIRPNVPFEKSTHGVKPNAPMLDISGASVLTLLTSIHAPMPYCVLPAPPGGV